MGMTPALQASGFSLRDLELEHRITKLEVASTKQQEATAKMERRMALQERGLLALLFAVTAVAHERIPWLAKLLIGLIKTSPP